MISIKIFLCYVFADKHIGGELKECLENEFSFEVFVAHDDIEAGAEWNGSILDTIHTSNHLSAIQQAYNLNVDVYNEIYQAPDLKISL